MNLEALLGRLLAVRFPNFPREVRKVTGGEGIQGVRGELDTSENMMV